MPYRIALVLLFVHSSPAFAQTYTLGGDLLFYGDNTEFTNPFRAGATTLGTSGSVFLDARLNDTVTIRGGLFGLGRYGAHEFLEHAEPAIRLEVSRGTSRLLFGSLETTSTRHDVDGPDLETPHRLLPPIHQETLTFTRGQETGLQWLVDGAAFEHDAWINWQRLNTAAHRERFDAGYRASLPLTSTLRVQGQWHVVHQGGQQFQSGVVADSQAAALGLQSTIGSRGRQATFDGHVLITNHAPDRERPALTETGVGLFLRGALQRRLWRTHLIVWRSRDTLKEEGDSNYLAARRDGQRFRKPRDYAELGVTRHFRPAPGVHMFASVRIHRIESHYEYSYRIVARVRVRHRFE